MSRSLKDYLKYIFPPKYEINNVPLWPPDLFGVSAFLIDRLGIAYLAVHFSKKGEMIFESDWPGYWKDGSGPLLIEEPMGKVEAIARQWWRYLEGEDKFPTELNDCWQTVIQNLALEPDHFHKCLAEDNEDHCVLEDRCRHALKGSNVVKNKCNYRPCFEVARALFKLLCIADEVSTHVGISNRYDKDEEPSKFLNEALLVLRKNDHKSLCKLISPDTLTVLPKQHTPQSGMTLRSLSHNLCFLDRGSVSAKWVLLGKSKKKEASEVASATDQKLNLLLLPWPTYIDTGSFSVLEPGMDSAMRSGKYRFFHYNPLAGEHNVEVQKEKFFKRLTNVWDEVQRRKDAKGNPIKIHGMVFPELSIPEVFLDDLREFASNKEVFIHAGIHGDNGDGQMKNYCVMDFYPVNKKTLVKEIQDTLADYDESLKADLLSSVIWGLKNNMNIQYKHHRWALDQRQLKQYGLSEDIFPRDKIYWEYSVLGHREVYFFTLQNGLTLTSLICEDLARQDPVSTVIRAVGPNLVIALLMDGPQINGRWPSKYASVLADDPGSSVLTLTSYGMVALSDPGSQLDRSYAVALWRDPIKGERYFQLGKHDEAILLNLEIESHVEYTADGRSCEGSSSFAVYSSHENILSNLTF